MNLIFSLFISLLSVLPGNWQMVGPGGTEMREMCTVGNKVFSINYYLQTDEECRTSIDNGLTWDLSVIAEYGCYGLSSDAFNRVFIAGVEHIQVSSDLGDSWETFYTIEEACSRHVAANPNDSLHLLVATSNLDTPLIQSFDGGVTWSTVDDFPFDIVGHRVVFGPLGSNTVYLAGYLNQTPYPLLVYKSVNNGFDWFDISPSPAVPAGSYPRFDMVVSSDNADVVFVTAENRLINTIDGGTNWDQILEANHELEDILYISSASEIYAASRDELYISENFGQNWSSLSMGSSYVWSLAISDYNGEQRFHTGSSNGHYYTDTLLTEEWTQCNTGIPGTDVFALLEGVNSGFPVFTGKYFLDEDPLSWTGTGFNPIYTVYHAARAGLNDQLLFTSGSSG